MNENIEVYLILICVVTIITDGGLVHKNSSSYHEAISHTLARYTRQSSKCRLDEMQCRSGRCISEDKECDGKPDCQDQDDESNCAGFPCGPNFFQCAYGACINQNDVCNGKKDCMDNSDETSPLCKGIPVPGCRIGEFQCDSGDCVSEDALCDGKADCPDASDETTKVCAGLPCNEYITFRCDYGACVNKDAKCNGVSDCVDGSDERNCPTTRPPIPPPTPETTPSPIPEKLTPKPTEPGGCSIPIHPSNGEYWHGSKKAIPGEYIPSLEALILKCKEPEYKPIAEHSFCFDGTWVPNPSECVPTDKSGCLIPDHPNHGQYHLGREPATPRTYAASEGNPLVLKCNGPVYKPSPPSATNKAVSNCLDGEWTPKPATCARACQSLSSTSTTKITCKHGKDILENCNNPVDNTVAIFECASFHEMVTTSRNPEIVCKDGTWDDFIRQCHPGQPGRPKKEYNMVEIDRTSSDEERIIEDTIDDSIDLCGEKRAKGTPNAIGAGIARALDYPWHVGIYNTTRGYLCGGSIISSRLVLSAAHCFTEINNGRLKLDANNYIIVAGKYYSDFYHDNDQEIQEFTIANIFLPERYKGFTHFLEADLAVVVLNERVRPTLSVQQVCVDWRSEFEHDQLINNNIGVVSILPFINDELLTPYFRKALYTN
ncbi:hypothetical protein PPYR_01354 [Photinus pyralis]|uniref:Peptidase S1 domain-containing protein n=1 Tax=Photinus pyralis TaxID=7054 RepID=A0A5N4B4A9_PHOPY|nr:hypothetical protein PPYR_01354 [Photinus pyralis]